MSKYKYTNGKGEHLHSLDGKPLIGTSSVSDVLSKPLTWWSAGLAVKELGVPDAKVFTKIKSKKATEEEIKALETSCGLRLEEIKGMSVKDYIDLLNNAYKAHSVKLKDSAQAGTDLHAELEKFVKNTMENRMATYDAKIQPFIDWSVKNVKRFIYSEAYCYSEKLWVGGISDCCAELNDGKIIIIDFKSSKEAYLSQFWQCVGYAIQIEENGWFDENGNQLGKLEKPIDYVCVVPFGAEVVEPQFFYDVDGGKEAFGAEVLLYKKLNQ